MLRSLPALVYRYWPLPLLAGIALFTAAPFLSDRSTKLDLLTQFLLQAAAGTAGLAVLFLLLRRRLAAAIAGICLVSQVAVLEPPLIPARATTAHDGGVEVLFANIWWHNAEAEALVRRIVELGPDVVVLAELNEGARAIADRLGDAYPYRADCLSHWTCDSAVLSRLPIIEDLSDRRTDRRAAMSAARLQAPFGTLAVAGVHLDQPLPLGRLRTQLWQSGGIIEMLAPIGDPLLLVGDFNAVPWGRVMRRIAAETGLEIAHGLEGTWHSALPWPMRIPIDHALTGRGLQLLEREVIRLPGSDHRALRLRVGLSEA